MHQSIYQQALKLQEETTALRHWLHAHPEASFHEFETAKRIREELKQRGIEFEAAGETGTVGIIRGKSAHPVIALRADIDALEIQEKNAVSYRSVNEGLMHACGHDSHAASLLTAAKILQAQKAHLNGTVKLIFQPAEEVGLGAQTVIDTGLLDDVEAFFGIHVRAGLPVGKIAVQAGPIMAGANSLEINVFGESGHAGHPDQAVDAIAAGAQIVGALQSIVSREVSPTDAAVLSICQFHAGTRDNIIANHARISGTVRILSEDVREQVTAAIDRIVQGVSAAYRVKSQVSCKYATPVLSNSQALYPVALAAAQDVVTQDGIQGLIPKLGTEDFSAYAKIAPVFFTFVGSGGEFPHHHERFDIDENALAIASALYAQIAVKYFETLER